MNDSKKGRLSSITSAPISVLHLLLLLDMMSYLKITLRLMGSIKIISRNSMQIKQSSKLKQMFAAVLLKKFTTAYKIQMKIPRSYGQNLNMISLEVPSSTQ